ncbi:MAG: fatty acid desaturase [Acidimicrobiales bacterium]|nr:fatty acid desaturase [Acidimicrobiales bacterium]
MTDLAPPPTPVATAMPTPPALTLRDVISTVPAEFRQRSTARGLAIAGRDIAIYGGAVTGLILTHSWWATLLFWAVAGFAVAAMFVAGHDAAHGTLTDNNRLNGFLGRLLFLPSLHNYEAWVLGHNRIHHGHTVKQNMDFVWHPLTVDDYRRLGALKKLRHRLEWSMFGAGAYYTRDVWWTKMIRLTDPPPRFAKGIRRDARLLYITLLGAAVGMAFLGGLASGDVVGALWLITEVLVVPAMLFMWIIGWTVYVHHIDPDIKWYHRHEWTKVAGQLEGTTILRIPKFWDLFFHSIFIHTPHHVDMRIPCYHLAGAAEAIKAAFPDRVIDRKLRLRDYFRATRTCKLYDFDNHEWLPYAAATNPPMA